MTDLTEAAHPLLVAQQVRKRVRPLREAREIYATCMASADFDNGVTLVASIHRFDRTRTILIGDLGLTTAQQAVLEKVENVEIFRPEPSNLSAGKQSHSVRLAIVRQIVETEAFGTLVFWIDPDIALYAGLDPTFETIRDDSLYLLSRRSNSSEAIDEGCFGFRIDPENVALLDASLQRQPKPDGQALSAVARGAGCHIRTGSDAAIAELDDLDMSAHRGAKDTAGQHFRHGAVTPGKPMLRHHGAMKDFSGLSFAYRRKNLCGILGNGPSLSKVDLTTLTDMDTVGMNAALRFWHKIGWYPTLYCCLDEVVGMSLRNELIELVAKRKTYGIELFIVRRNLFDWLDSQGVTDGVICFDILRDGYDILMSNPVTTGSHAMGWAVVTGYHRLLLAGIDGNYVEQVQGSELKDNIVMEIVSDGHNPNYFFDEYQQVGDKYLKPNPTEDMHTRSWLRIKRRFPKDVLVVNCNKSSLVDAFPRVDLETARKSLKQPR